MNISGKTCLITGASSGLGLAAASQFAKLGANVILLCRDQEKGKNAVNRIRQDTPNASLELMICDLASIESVHSFICKFRESQVVSPTVPLMVKVFPSYCGMVKRA